MLQSKQYSESWYFVDFNVFSSLPNMLRKSLKELIFLVIPEDTTDNVSSRDRRVRGVEVSNIQSIGKAMFWIIIALMLSLSIGQLR